MRRTDLFHLLLMLGALALTYMLPFELVLLSYVILGPAHYLTEISWLHDRSYFLPRRSIAFAATALCVSAPLWMSPKWFGMTLWSTFIFFAVLAATKNALQRAALLMAAGCVTVWMYFAQTPFTMIVLLLPSLVHVSIFTLVFMIVGAVRSKSMAQAALVMLYLTSIGAILLLPPSGDTVIPKLVQLSQSYFSALAPALGSVFGIRDLEFDPRITGLFSFVYTYHYLNWFIKADVIKWARVPKLRLAAIALASAASTALYFYDFVLGFMILTALSLSHVVLEFPLNSISIRDLGAIMGHGLRHPAKAAPVVAS
jgi:hypothetical protein